MADLTGIFETHAHYDFPDFDADREELLGKLLPDSGVWRVINVGTDAESSAKSVKLAEKYPYIYASVGFHPSNTAEMAEKDLAFFTKLSANPKVVAVGEIGLDYHYDNHDVKAQKYWFSRQLELADSLNLPVIIHSRDADDDMYRMLSESVGSDKPFLPERADRRGVLHCYSQSAEMARKYVEMGFYIGVGGIVTYPKTDALRAVVESIPLERILLETDSPYLSPAPLRGRRNSSQNLSIIAEKIGQIAQTSAEKVVSVTRENALALFDGK